MGILTKDRGITTKGVRALFVASYVTRRRRLLYPKFVEVIDSHVESDFAKTIGTVPQLTEVISDVNAPPTSDFSDYAWTWVNRLYQSRIAISRDVQDFDQTGQVRTLLHSMAARLANFPDLLFITRLLTDSFNGGDGVALYSASHPAPRGSSTAQSNLYSGTTPTDFATNASVVAMAEQLKTDFRNAMARMRSFRDDNGQPWHDDDIKPEDLVILCSPLLETAMKQAFLTGTIGASDNVMKGQVREIITSNYLPQTGALAADWYICNVGQIKRPFVYSRFRRIRDEEIEDYFGNELTKVEGDSNGITLDDLKEFSSVQLETNLNKQGMNADADVMENNRFLVQCRWRGEIFGGEWRNTIRVDNAAT